MTHSLSFNGQLLRRGFWLYVWEIKTADGVIVHYVGKTGDKPSGVSQSPFNRLANHLGGNKNSNALRQYLERNEIEPEECSFQFHAFGPLYSDDGSRAHGALCDATSALEKGLADALRAAGYSVLNTIKCRMDIDPALFSNIKEAFAEHFPLLRAASASEGTR